MMDFIIPHDIGFSSPTYPIGFVPIDREDAMSLIVNEFLCLVWVRAYGPGNDKYARLRRRLSFDILVSRRSCELIEEHATWGMSWVEPILARLSASSLSL